MVGPRIILATPFAGTWSADTETLLNLLAQFGAWRRLKTRNSAPWKSCSWTNIPDRKILVFTQFADTVRYLEMELKARGVSGIAAATGDMANPTELAWRFSPKSNDKTAWVSSRGELRVLVATDVLSEGQNLQDCAIVVNYDLPWAIIRLIQRPGAWTASVNRREIFCAAPFCLPRALNA